MAPADRLASQGHRLLQIGVVFLLFASLEGFAIPRLASPRVGLSAHTLSGLQGVLLIAQGLLWPRLRLGARGSTVAYGCAILSAAAILAAYVAAAVLGVGGETLVLVGELPHGLSRGSSGQEALIRLLAYISAPAGLIWLGLVLWGLRAPPARGD
jgi:hydroxylaminobenzene mutase